MFIFGGAVGIIGNVFAGRLGDAIGRRWVGFGMLALFPLFAWIFYHGPSWSLPLAWIGVRLLQHRVGCDHPRALDRAVPDLASRHGRGLAGARADARLGDRARHRRRGHETRPATSHA